MKTTITVQNLKCGGFVNTITKKISAIENISRVKVVPEASLVSFQNKDIVDAFKVKKKLKKLGYPAIDEKINLITKANSMISCATDKL